MAFDYTDTGPFLQLGKFVLTWYQLKDLTRELSYNDGGSNLFHSLDSLAEELTGQFNSTAEQRRIADRLLGDLRSMMDTVDGSWQQSLKGWCDEFLAQIVAPALNIPDTDPDDILRQLYLDMKANSETVDGNAVACAAASAAAHNAGSTVVLGSVLDREADNNQLVRGQTVTVACTGDAPNDGRTAGEEQLTARGEPVEPNDGSGGSVQIEVAAASAADAANTDGNRLDNGNFETFTVANTPDNWTIDTGTAGTHILSEATEHYLGTKSLELQGDGALATIELHHDLHDRDPELKPHTVYAVNCFIKTSAVTQGTITVQLQGTDYTSSQNITVSADWPTSWTAKNFFTCLPKSVPSDLKLVVKVSNTLNDDGIVWIDNIALVEAVEFGEAGLYLAAFQGAADPVAGEKPDTWALACTSDEAGRFQCFLRDVYGTYLPFLTDTNETIPDSLSQ